MKLRVRLSEPRCDRVIQLEGSCATVNLGQVIDEIKHELNVLNFTISLNGQDILSGNASTLAELGVVSGDLILVHSSESISSPLVTNITASNSVLADKSMPNCCAFNEPAYQQPASTVSHEMSNNCEKIDTSNETNTICQNVNIGSKRNDNNEKKSYSNSDATNAVSNRSNIDKVNKYLQLPMLLRDTTDEAVPESLIITYQKSNPQSGHEALAVLIHVLMIESNFSPVQKEQDRYSLPDKWKFTSSAMLRYVNEKSGKLCTVACVPVGKQVVIHGVPDIPKTGLPKIDVKVTCSSFLKSIQHDPLLTFTNVKQFAILVKDNIVAPLLQVTAGESDELISLTTLPLDVIMNLLKYLGCKDLLHLSAVCKKLRYQCTEPWLWRRLYIIHYGKLQSNDLSQDWIQLYKMEFLTRHRPRPRIVPEILPFTVIPQQPFNPFNPGIGIIGGDYDRNPFIPDPFGIQPGSIGNLPRPRFDPYGPLPHQRLPRFGRGGFGKDRFW